MDGRAAFRRHIAEEIELVAGTDPDAVEEGVLARRSDAAGQLGEAIDLSARRQEDLQRLDPLLLTHALATTGPRAEAEAGRRHEGRHAELIRQLDQRAMGEQELDHRNVGGTGCAEKRGRAGRKDDVRAALEHRLAIARPMDELDVGIGALVQEHLDDIDRRLFVGHRPADARGRRAHIHRVIEWRAAVEVPFVHIRARLDQIGGDIEMPVQKRDVERRQAQRVGQIEIGPGLDQHLHARETPFARGVEQRREAAVIHVLLARLGGDPALPVPLLALGIDVGPVLDQELHHLGLALSRRPHQR